MAPVSNRFAKYVVQQDEAGGGRASKPNRFAKYKAVEAPAAPQTNPMEAQGQAAQQEWRDAGSKPTNPNPENPIVTAQRGSQTAAMSQWSQQREAERQAEAARSKSRRESATAFGGGMDMLPTEDAGGNVRPGTAIDADISKGIIGAPLQALEAVKDAGVSMANLAGETYNTVNSAITTPLGVKPMQVPKITTPDNPLIGQGGALQSVTGDLERNLMQFLISRKIVGNVAPGGGTAAQLGKDALALGAGFDADTGRLSETVNEFVQQSGSPQVAKDYIGWLAERDPNNPLLERFKNMVEDLTISGPLVAPQAAVRGGQAIGNALAPVARTPTNAGGTAARAAVADPYLVREASPAPAPGAAGAAPAAPQKSMFSSTGQYSVSTQDSGAFDVNLNRMNDGGAVIMHDKGTIPIAPEFAKGKSDEELLAYYFEPLGFQGATKAASAVQPPITAFPVTSPRPPTTRSQAAGAGAPPPPAQPPAVVAQPGAGAPPPGTLTPVPTPNAATAEFNALPRKVRESVFRAMRNSGFDNNGVIAAIRDLNTLPPDRQSMFATELVRKYGAQFPELEANLAAMGRKFAVDTPKPRQIFGRTIERDGARQVMNDEVRSQIDSEADYLNGTVERLFGPGAVPAKEELLRLQQAGGAEYRRLLSTTNRYGRARAPAKRAEIDRNVATLANYLKRPEVMNNVPDWVKQKVMLEVSNDLRQLKFTPDEQAIIVAGDPGLAALFTPDAPLAYSPQLWKTLVDLYPTQSAHSLQSAYAKAIREARFSPDPQTRVWVDTLSRARGKSTVRANAKNTDDRGFGLLKMLEDAVPGYKEARMKYGNVMGAQEALDDARQFMSIAGDETKLAQFVDDFEDLSDLQRTAVENQVSSIIRQSIANKVDNPKLAELGREGPSTPNLTAISKQPFLDALPKVFGAKGQEMADAIRTARSNTDYLTGLHPKYNSRTGVNDADVKNADRIYEDPAGAESSLIDNAVTQGLGGAGLGAAFIPGAAGAALPLIGLAAAKALWTARKAGKRLSPSEKTQLAEFLFRSRRQGGSRPEGGTSPGNPPQLPGPRGPSLLDTGGNMAAGSAIGAAAGGAASGGDPTVTLAGAGAGAGAGALRARLRNSSSLVPTDRPANRLKSYGGGSPPPNAPNALATPPRPPEKAGFGGGSKQPLPMDEASRMGRAREQGFDVDTPLYHGTSGDFDAFRASRSGVFGPGVYVSEDPSVASSYAQRAGAKGGSPNVMPLFVRGRVANDAEYQAAFRQATAEGKQGSNRPLRIAQILKQKGFSGARIPGDGDLVPSQIVVFDPNDIRGKFAAFDPSQSGSSKLLAGMGASPEAVGGATGAGIGYFANPSDANDDGVIDDKDRGLNAMGGLMSGVVGGNIAKRGVNAMRNITPPKGPPTGPAQATFGGSKQPLPMDEASRMGRAREQGFDVDTPLYHGTTEAFEEFDPAKTGSKFGYDKKGFFFSDDPKTARSYSYTPDEKRDSWARFSADGKAMADARTVKTYVRLKDPITLEELAAHPEYKRAPYEDPTDIYDNNRALIEKISEGRDGVDLRFRGQRLVNVFDPANIRRTDAAFDPSQSGSSKLLAGMGASPEAAGAIGGGAAGYALAPDQNGDGVVDAQERAAGGLGGFVSGIGLAKGAKAGVNALKLTPPKPTAPKAPRAPKAPLPTTMRELQEAYQAATTRAERKRIQKQMAQVGSPANALASPPRPPEKAGFGRGSKQPLPMDEASRMGRAREQGFDVDTPLYHGSPNGNIQEMNRGTGYLGDGVYLTADRKAAAGYKTQSGNERGVGPITKASRAITGKVYETFVRGKGISAEEYQNLVSKINLESANGNIFAADPSQTRAKMVAQGQLSEQGITHVVDGDLVMVFNPKNVRSTNATFDPSQSGSSKLLAGIGGSEGVGGFGGAVAGGALAPDANNDGVVDAQERAAGAFGGALSGIVGAKAVRAGGNALAKVGKAPSVERGPVRFGGKTDGAGPPSVSDRPWSVEDNRTALPPRPPVKAGFGRGSKQPLPMDEASRMGRAREQGFDVDTPLYHGTPDSRGVWEEGFKTPKEKYGDADPDRVYFFSEDRKTASTYADDRRAWDYQNATAETIPVYLRLRNPATVEWNGRPFRGREKDGSGYAIRDYIDKARADGHDGIIIRNVIDTYDGTGKPTTIRAVFDPANIRSTNAAFDPSQSGSSKLLAGMGASPEAAGAIGGGAAGYALAPDQNGDGVVDAQERAAGGLGGFVSGIAGAKIVRGAGNALRNTTPPKGPPSGPAQQTFGGVKAKTADLKLQRIAQDMEKAGASRDQIWKETGWFKGNDGKWRFEIDDSASRLGDRALEDFVDKGAAQGKAAGVLWNKPVYDAYPEMRDVTISARNAAPASGTWDRSSRIDVEAPTSAEARQMMLHEGQHAVQDTEGFARGGSPDRGNSRDDIQRFAKQAYEESQEISDAQLLWELGGEVGPRPASVASGKKWEDLPLREQVKWYEAGRNRAYRYLAGETEARNVELRRDFTPEERRARPPWTTQDVPDEQQIVRYGSGHANSEPTPRQSITLAETKDANGKPVTVKGEAFNDRGRMVLSPEWPTNAFDELEKARQKAAMDSAFPPKPGPKLVDENYGKPPKPRSEWEVENPKAAEEIGRKVAERFVGLMNADPSPVHVLALKEGVDIQSIGNIIEGGLPKNRQIWIAKDGGEIAVVDKAWHRQNPQEYTTERWNRMWPSSVTREGRRYGWQEGRPFIFADEAPNPPPAQAGFSFGGGKGPPQPQANALASPPKKPRPVEARREAPRGNKPFNNPSLSQGENKISEMLLNGYEYPAIADEMMTSVDVVKQLAKRAQDKLGDAVKLPRPGMGKRPVGSTKREAAFGLFDEGLDNATIAQRTGLSLGNVRTYRSYWKQESGAPVANVNGASYNPPEMPPRPFEADYPQKDWPNGPPVDAQGRLVFDMEGRPLNQNATIVGRSKAPGVGSQSEADRPLRDKTATIQTLRNTGSEFERTPRENLPGQTDGYWNPSYADNGRFTGRGSAVIADDLDRPVMGLDDQELMTIAHELAHNIDFKTNPARSVDDYNARKWGIDPADSPGKAKVNDQLLRIYRDLNNAPGAEAKIGRPLDRGYQQAEEARELWAEAIRAYMWDPNYIKTVAPDVAFLIRHHVNGNSSLRKTIQFNAVPTIAAMGGLGLGAAALNGQPAEAKTRSSGMRANALAPAQNNRP